MSASFLSEYGSIFVSNERLSSLIEFAIETAPALASSSQETAYVTKLADRQRMMYPGFDLSIEAEFPARDERLFWSRVFCEVAARIGNGTVGNTDPPVSWRPSAQADALAASELLHKSAGEA